MTKKGGLLAGEITSGLGPISLTLANISTIHIHGSLVDVGTARVHGSMRIGIRTPPKSNDPVMQP